MQIFPLVLSEGSIHFFVLVLMLAPAAEHASSSELPAVEPMRRQTSHLHGPRAGCPFHNVADELLEDLSKDDVRTMRNFPKAFYDDVVKYYPLVRSVGDIVGLPTQLSGTNEFGISPMFAPLFVDATAQQGMFPMALDLAKEIFVFAPKCHEERAFTPVLREEKQGSSVGDRSQRDDSSFSPCGRGNRLVAAFDPNKIGHSCRLAKKLRVSVVHRISLDTPQGIQEAKKVGESLQMIFEQHTENWLCRQLRACLGAMMKSPEAHATTFLFTLIEQDMTVPHKNGPEKPPTPPASVPKPKSAADRKKIKKAAKENPKAPPQTCLSPTSPLVACEIGYVVGDIYTSYTGAYVVSGTGSISLAVTAKILSLLGVRTWDLGMQLDYKEHALNTTTMLRQPWLEHVRERVHAVRQAATSRAQREDEGGASAVVNPFLSNPWTQRVLSVLGRGVNAADLLTNETLSVFEGDGEGNKAEPSSEGDARQPPPAHVSAEALSKAQLKKQAKKAFVQAKKDGTLTEEQLLGRRVKVQDAEK